MILGRPVALSRNGTRPEVPQATAEATIHHAELGAGL